MAALSDLNTFLIACGQPAVTAGQATRVGDWLKDVRRLDSAGVDDLGAWFYQTVREQVISHQRQQISVSF
jgi:hypothetical protein